MTSSSLSGKHIVLGITGGIAVYKSVALLRLLVKAGAEVQVVATPAALEFVRPVTFASLSQKPVVSEFFTANSGEWHSHVDLGLWADAMVIAPATACTLAKMASGVADNMLVTTYLSARAPVFVAPAMDLDMMAHPTTQRNLATLRADGVHIIEATGGQLASGLSGKGRMEEPENICAILEKFFSQGKPLSGKQVLITAGPTYERIDPVRFIGNFSTGKMGFALAEAAAAMGAEVTVVAGPSAVPTPAGVHRVDVESALQMLEATRKRFAQSDIVIFAAAVADYAPAHPADHKIKRERAQMGSIELVKNPDIAATLAAERRPGQILAGFALETENGVENGLHKLRNKHLDLIIMNSLADKGAGFGTDTNKVTILRADSATELPLMSKRMVADAIMRNIAGTETPGNS